MKRFIAVTAAAAVVAFAAAASAITVDGYKEYQEKIAAAKDEQSHYEKNSDYCEKKLEDTSWWNLYGKVRWGLEKWSNDNKAAAAADTAAVNQERLDEELAAEKKRQEAEAKRAETTQNNYVQDIQYLTDKIKGYAEDEKHYTENAEYADKKLDETAWWNLPGKLRWAIEKMSSESKAEDAHDSKVEWQKERDTEISQLKESDEDYAFRQRLAALKEEAMKGGQKEKDYYEMMEKAYEYYKLKEKYEKTPTFTPILGFLPKIVNKLRYDNALKEAQEAQKKVYPNLYETSGTTSVTTCSPTKLTDINSKLTNQGIKENK